MYHVSRSRMNRVFVSELWFKSDLKGMQPISNIVDTSVKKKQHLKL